ncbi:endonuclease MutS2 [Synechococcus sp. CS-602]|uniref:endonuclease MutS2 n=1 Tax=Synechococcaceae TaxID=1890426 RepID=UPI0021A3B3B3|nr:MULTISPECIES: endonuclease MutS2 [Synechococcaceae]MCT0201352.1 endonuclease MutS2 [Synechococcus sp. CS-603]MCT0205902.1 endonuclease MutS2 [Synechococcus sp. CS-602]MCT4363932.1 endonuclease MutS2 [Candidatus Regnicoccus frigidus MAG-AL1]MCT4366950.1 endonuclease MutS2 [Candidatus Regnicoccus frigidus MAG-AL2]
MSGIEAETLALLEWPRLAEHLASFASTVAGRQRCRALPLAADCAASKRRLLETTELLGLDGLIEGGLSFQGACDLAATLLHCSKGGTASAEALLAVATTLAAGRRLRRQIEDPQLRPACTDLVQELRSQPELEQRLRFCLEEGGRVADRACPALAGLRQQLAAGRLLRRERLQELLRRLAPLLQDTVISERNGRPVLAVKAGAASQLSGLVHDTSASGSTVFIEPQAVIALGNRLREWEGQERQAEQRVLAELSGLVALQAEALGPFQEALVQLDFGLARARYGLELGAVRPELSADPASPWLLHGLRHPLLLWQQRHAGGQAVVPVSVTAAAALRVVAITGPNTGGKTVTLKSVGLAALMARAGLFLPCAGTPRLPWCSLVLADIGDEQSLQQNLSTFSGHVRRIARILAALPEPALPQPAAGASLVLLDEVGAGTDPGEGAALAIALLRHLADRARLTLATTHFGELKALKYGDPRFENASVGFDLETLSPTYQLQWGIPGRSNALAIAARLGLSGDVIASATDLLAPRGDGEVNQVIRGLEDQRRRQQEAAEDAAALLARTELLHEELLQRWQQQQEQSAELQEQRRQALELSIRSGQKEVRRLIHRLRQGQADGESARQAGQRLKRLEQQHRPQPQRREPNGWRPVLGERIRLLSLGKAAEVLAISPGGAELTVRCGVLRLTVELSAIESLSGEKPAPVESAAPKVQIQMPASHRRSGPEVRTERNTVDVRGLRVHEAEAAVEETLRGARGPVWVIHGIGTGKLKRGLRQWLDTLPWVERVSDAEKGDGGPGCSVVWVA